MKKKIRNLIIVVLVSIVSSCGGDPSLRVNNSYKLELGVSTRAHIISVVDEELRDREHFEYERTVNSGETVYMETQWKQVQPLDDEVALGFKGVQQRIIVRARPKTRSSGGVQNHRASFTAEVIVQYDEATDFVPAQITSMRREELRKIAYKIKPRLSGLRQ